MRRPRKILVGIDFSETSARAFETALELAARYGAEVHLVHALEVPMPIFEPYAVTLPVSFVTEARKTAQQKLDRLLARVRERGLQGSAQVAEVPAASTLADRARELPADLLVVGTRGLTGLKHVLLGSVAERTVREAPCSVLTVKGEGPAAVPPRAIAAGVDFSPASAHAVETALDLAREFGATLHLVHALDLRIPFVTPYEVSVPDVFIESAREAALARLRELTEQAKQGGVDVRSHLASAPPSSALAETAEQLGVDLLVTGSRGLTGLKHVVLGSVAERTLRHAPCSVLTVKGAKG